MSFLKIRFTYEQYTTVFVFDLLRQSLGPSMLLKMAFFHSFLWLSILPMYLCITSFSSVDGPLGCFHVLALVNSAARNMGVLVPIQIMVFFRYMPRYSIFKKLLEYSFTMLC